jgi:hypothetical protein
MKVHKITAYIIDHDGLGKEGVIDLIENTRYPNHCHAPNVMTVDTKDIGEWDDDHPLNCRDTARNFIDDLYLEPHNH